MVGVGEGPAGAALLPAAGGHRLEGRSGDEGGVYGPGKEGAVIMSMLCRYVCCDQSCALTNEEHGVP